MTYVVVRAFLRLYNYEIQYILHFCFFFLIGFHSLALFASSTVTFE